MEGTKRMKAIERVGAGVLAAGLGLGLGLGLGVLLGAGCADGQDDMQAADLGRTQSPVVLRFTPRVGPQPFACGQKYPGIGLGGSGPATIEAEDFRLYVHDVRLVDTTGAEVPVRLDEDQKWQASGVALLDFEDKTGLCAGTTATNTEVRGSIAVGAGARAYKGVRFRVGVPFPTNHGDAATAPSPLNLTTMFWTWQSGYKFVRIEGHSASGTGFIVHLGSTGCTKDAGGQVTACQSPNRPEVALDGFDPTAAGARAIAVDLAGLLGGSDLGKDVECMSGPGAADCVPLFARLGLAYDGAPAGAQALFRLE